EYEARVIPRRNYFVRNKPPQTLLEHQCSDRERELNRKRDTARIAEIDVSERAPGGFQSLLIRRAQPSRIPGGKPRYASQAIGEVGNSRIDVFRTIQWRRRELRGTLLVGNHLHDTLHRFECRMRRH